MTKIGLFYGTETGNTEYIAELIAKEFDYEIIIEDIGQASVDEMQKCDLLIFGVPTWDYGQPDSDWEAFFPNLDKINFADKKIALFGLGDQEMYADTFLEAMATIYNKFLDEGADIIGEWPTEGYNYAESSAVIDNKFVGLAIDEENQAHLTASRVKKWVGLLKKELS